jgi:hypothetical protein
MSVTINGTTGISTIPDDIVTTDKILDAAVTTAKLDSGVLTDYTQRELMASQSMSGTEVDFINIPAWAKRVSVMLSGVSLSSTSRPLIQMGVFSGMVTTGYDSVAVKTSNATAITATSSTAGFVIDSPLAANAVIGTLTFSLLSGNYWVGSGVVKTNATSLSQVAGEVNLGATLETIRITTVNGTDTLDAGTVSILVEG